jgi:hypothetical protein
MTVEEFFRQREPLVRRPQRGQEVGVFRELEKFVQWDSGRVGVARAAYMSVTCRPVFGNCLGYHGYSGL